MLLRRWAVFPPARPPALSPARMHVRHLSHLLCTPLLPECAGDNSMGDLGTGGTPSQSAVPLPVAGNSTYSTIYAGTWGYYACGLVDSPGTAMDRTLECWCGICKLNCPVVACRFAKHMT